jgi:hypothetical protein
LHLVVAIGGVAFQSFQQPRDVFFVFQVLASLAPILIFWRHPPIRFIIEAVLKIFHPKSQQGIEES